MPQQGVRDAKSSGRLIADLNRFRKVEQTLAGGMGVSHKASDGGVTSMQGIDS
jgi:hypothetical protein